ncbi:MAG: hypothetical protein NW207_02525 [Cytophagales bacterium]|nr:hypothetical protein [Cytophagales bacterium]
MMKKILPLICYLITFAVYSQKGDYFISNYSPENEQIENENFAIVQDSRGQMFFANNRGVLRFDGRTWEIINTPSTSIALYKHTDTDNIYVGCLDDFGVLTQNTNGTLSYKSLYHAQTDLINVSQITSLQNTIYFMTESNVYVYDIATDKIISKIQSTSVSNFSAVFEMNNNIYIQDIENQIYTIDKNELLPTTFAGINDEKIIFTSTDKSGKMYLIATQNNNLYSAEGTNITYIPVEDKAYLNFAAINGGVMVSDNVAAISTNKGGVLLLNPRTGKTISVINYYSGLPDDEIFAIGMDNQSGVWVAHEYGFSRIDYTLPFRNYTSYPGLEGHIETVAFHNGKLWVGTSEGLYYLDKVINYNDVSRIARQKLRKQGEDEEKKEGKLNTYVRDQKTKFEKIRNFFGFRKKSDNKENIPAETNPDTTKVDKKKNKKFLGIFNRKDKEIEQPALQKSTNIANSPATLLPAKPKDSIKKQIASNEGANTQAISSIKYMYKKLQGMDAKCRQLIPYSGLLYAATQDGVYEINDKKYTKISYKPTTHLYICDQYHKIFTGTSDNKLLIFSKTNTLTWGSEPMVLGPYHEPVNTITEDNEHNIWVSFSTFLIKLTNNAGNYDKTDTIPVYNPFSDDLITVHFGGQTHVIISNKAYSIAKNSTKLQKSEIEYFKSGNFSRLIHSQHNAVWVNKKHDWQCFGNCPLPTHCYPYFNMFSNIQDIIVQDNGQKCWIITKNDEIFLLDPATIAKIPNKSLVFLKNITGNDGTSLESQKLLLDETHSHITFTYVNPVFIDNQAVEYQYYVKNLMNTWSEWSTDNNVSFSYIPSGSYELVMRSRNVFGQVTESAPIKFKIEPPYWQQWWFYLSEVLFFGTLLVVSFVLNRSNIGNPWISRVLTFITIVMLIELADTVIASYFRITDSPVTSFAIQVGIALLVLPFERVLSAIIQNQTKIELPLKKRAANKE